MSNPIYLYQLIYQAKTQPVPATEDISRLEWTIIWTDPVRIRPGLPAPEHPFLALPAPAKEDIPKYRWYEWLSDPVRIKLALPVAEQQFLALTPPQIAAATGTGDLLWHSPWSSVMVQNIMLGEG